MKKLVTMTLAAVACLMFTLSFAACEQPCFFHETWSQDETHHWHACVDPSCEEVSDKSEHSYGEGEEKDGEQHVRTCVCGRELAEAHSWDDGTLKTPATAKQDGVMTYACSGCDATREEAVLFTGVTEEQWNAAKASENFDNVTITYEQMIYGEIEGEDTREPFGDKREYLYEISGEKISYQGQLVLEGADEEKADLIAILQELVGVLSEYTYDRESNSYSAPAEKTVQRATDEEIVIKNRVVVLDDENLIIGFSFCQLEEIDTGEDFRAWRITEYKMTFSNYGTTEIKQYSQAEWDAVKATENFENVTISSTASYYIEDTEHWTDEVTSVGQINGDNYASDGVYAPDAAAEVDFLIALVQAVLADRGRYAYNGEEDAYYAADFEITVEMYGQQRGYYVQEATVTFDGEGRVATLSFVFVLQAEDVYVSKMLLAFSEYGTTVVEVPAQ